MEANQAPPAATAARGDSPAPPTATSPLRRGIGLQGKILLFLVAILAVLALVAAGLLAQTLTRELTAEFQSKGEAIASSLANSVVDPIQSRDASTVQSLVDQSKDIEGVGYLMIYRKDKEIIAHTFAPFVPEGLVDKNDLTGMQEPNTVRLLYRDSESGQLRNIIDIGVPILAGELGVVRVGMNEGRIAAAAQAATRNLLIAFGATALFAALLGLFFVRQTVRPINSLVAIAQRVGLGDLSTLAPVTSRDEIGVLAGTFNDTIQRLRGLVRTEGERDEERRQREELQSNISTFLDIATEISDGDLTRRGEVTADVLGAVVDSINVMVEEIGETLKDVRTAASTVNTGAQEMISTTEAMVSDAKAQTEDANQVSLQVVDVTQAMHGVSQSAVSAAEAARATRAAAEKGQLAVIGSLEGMQRIRREVQGVARRMKSLGDRSLEISEIVDTISGISSQTNLLALNAAIEASGAGPEGARFTVVADEVRKLAEGAAQATKRIAQLIKTVQTEIQETVAAVEEGTREVEEGFGVTRQAGDRLKEIATIAGTSAGLTEEISQSTTQQASRVEQVASNVQSIAEVAKRTEVSVTDGRQVAEQMLLLANDLNAKLARFRLSS